MANYTIPMTGDNITEALKRVEPLSKEVKQLYYPTGTSFGTLVLNQYVAFADGTIKTPTSTSTMYNKRIRTYMRDLRSDTVSRLAISLDLEGYTYAIALYGPNGESGVDYIGFQQDTNGSLWLTGFTVIDPTAARAVIIFKRVVSGTDQTLTSTDVTAIGDALKVYTTTDKSLTQNWVPADAKATGGRIVTLEDRIVTLEDASMHWTSWTPILEQKRITDDGGIFTSTDNYQVHTKYIWIGRFENAAVRYAVKMNDPTYQFRVASYGENGSYGTGGVGTDFNGFLNSWTTGTVVLPADCRRFGVAFKKASGGQTQVGTDGAAIRAALSVLVATDTTLSISGRAADAKAVRDFIAPELSDEQKHDILNLVDSYIAAKSNIVYYYDQSINGLASSTYAFDNNNKLKLCCSVWADLIWSGISPDTFFGAGVTPSNYNATIVKAFDWGWKHPYYLHQRTDKLAVRSGGEVTGYWGYKEPDGDITKSYSYTTFYDPNGTLPNSQRFINNLIASSMACELYHMGYEVPIAKADVGDLIFFTAFPYELTPMINIKFRGIGHVGVIVGKTNGFFEIAECGTYSDGMPIAKVSIFNNDEANAARAGHLYRRTVMTFRHPAAFGVSSNVGSKITSIPARY